MSAASYLIRKQGFTRAPGSERERWNIRPMQDTDTLRVRFDEFELDEADARLTRDGRPIALPPKAFSVLCALARQPGQLMTKSALLDAVWGHQHVSESVLKSTISEVRDALADDAKQPRFIETAARRGYRFIAAANTLPLREQPTATAQKIEVPAPIRLESSLIGRRGALDRLRASWNKAANGQRQIFWVAGEAGIGKTTLLDAFVAELGPVARAHGQCVEQYGSGEPYLPILEALATLCRNDPQLIGLLHSVAPMWFLQLPWLGDKDERESLRRELSGVGPDRMLRELGELLDQYTQHRPLLLVIEDLHWSDHATLHLMNHIARRRGPARLMWLASFRLAEVIAEDHPLKTLRHELRLHKLCEEVVLDPFSERDVADYIDRRFPRGDVSENFVRAVHARTDGLPLFVVNVVDDLILQGALDAGASAAIAGTSQVPESLAGVIEKQIARLTMHERMLLEAASVCGVEFRPGTVADALGGEAPWATELCDELARRKAWLSGPDVTRLADGSLDARYTFRHALYRHVFYQRIGARPRSELHGLIATSLERTRAAGIAVTPVELATHYERSHHLMPALRYYIEATENAMRHFAPKEALDLAMHALTLSARCPAGPARAGVELPLMTMRGMAIAQLRGVSANETKEVMERAKKLLEGFPQHPLRGVVMHALGLVLMVRGEFPEALALAERLVALSTAQNDDPILLLSGCNLLGQVKAVQGKHLKTIEWLQQGIAVSKKVGDEVLQTVFLLDPMVTMHGALAVSLLHAGRIGDARASIAVSQTRARKSMQPMSRLVANWFNALFELRLHNPDRVSEIAADMRQIVDDSSVAQGEGPSRWFRGWADVHRGDPRGGAERIRDAVDYSVNLGMIAGAAEVLAYGAEALLLANDIAAAEMQLDEAMKLADRQGERVYLTQMHLLRARIAGHQGNRDGAREAMRSALREARDQQSPWLETTVLVAMAEQDPSAADLAALKDACSRLQDGDDLGVVKRAKKLLK
jgi:DNA-binding winged helix-turn-helix (wHTH) protein/tetratricopeptide (TPR) repeat protein